MQIKDIIEREEDELVDILRAVHVHGVDGDFDGCDITDKDPPSMSVQTATKKLKSSLRRVAKEAYRMGHIDHQLQLEGVTKELIKDMQKEGMLPKPKVKKTE